MSGDEPAWMVCDAIIAKAREDFLSQAISLMHEQVEKKNISLQGALPVMEEGHAEHEKDLFLLTQLMKEHANIEKQFASQVDASKVDGKALERAEELQKFLLSLRQIALFYKYGKVCEVWLVEVETELKERSPEEILARTAMHSPNERREVLNYLSKRRELFSAEEMRIIAGTAELLSKR